MDAGDDTAFLDAEVEPIAARALAAALSGVAWDEARVTGLASAVVEATIAGLAGLSKPFKYIVNIVLVQNVGGGLYSSVSEYVDAFHDGVCVVRWPPPAHKDESQFQAIVTVAGLSVCA